MRYLITLFLITVLSEVVLAQWSTTNPIYTASSVGIGTNTPFYKFDINVGTISVPTTGLAVYRSNDPNLGIRLMAGTGDNATYSAYNGGIGSWYGIGFYCNLDNQTRGVFNVRDGSFTMTGALRSNDGAFTGKVEVGQDGAAATMISGPAFSGAIQIKTHSAIGGPTARYIRLGLKDNLGVFTSVLAIGDDGNVGIGTLLTSNPNGYKLAVNGKIGAKEVQVENTSLTWSDYVFESDYKLMPLTEVDKFVKTYKHLPEVPSADDIKANGGHNLGEMDVLLLKKIEELTLHLIEQSAKIEKLEAELNAVKSK
ncbi:hypothetical protein SAMN04488109_2051 [Chryseolinea serpens]|uniref:Chaperone of endosialidase n=1 Tax=Chryseolinea serpens TaxID=947013 RepID=A0A1M5N190_9BACT|nr:tail fiber protein [Chryseolinea serpens]SHG83336.1 hypothetical protein SAMN04488109_2051 [Chryseolinea serpens]